MPAFPRWLQSMRLCLWCVVPEILSQVASRARHSAVDFFGALAQTLADPPPADCLEYPLPTVPNKACQNKDDHAVAQSCAKFS